MYEITRSPETCAGLRVNASFAICDEDLLDRNVQNGGEGNEVIDGRQRFAMLPFVDGLGRCKAQQPLELADRQPPRLTEVGNPFAREAHIHNRELHHRSFLADRIIGAAVSGVVKWSEAAQQCTSRYAIMNKASTSKKKSRPSCIGRAAYRYNVPVIKAKSGSAYDLIHPDTGTLKQDAAVHAAS